MCVFFKVFVDFCSVFFLLVLHVGCQKVCFLIYFFVFAMNQHWFLLFGIF